MNNRIWPFLLVLCMVIASCSTLSTPRAQQPTALPGGSAMTCPQLSLRPVMGPQYLPAELNALTLLQCESDQFLTEYRGTTKRLLLGAGALNVPQMDRKGQQRQITVRAQPGILQISDTSHPEAAVQLWWEEPGQWMRATGVVPRDGVFYLLSAEGIAPEDLVRIADGLRPLDLASQATSR